MLKKHMILFMATILCLSVAVTGCDKGGTDSAGDGASVNQIAQAPDSSTETKQAEQPTPPPEPTKGVIGLSVLTLTNPFFKEIADSMKTQGAQHGYEINVVSGEQDPARQNNQVKDFIVQGVAAIVLTPCDSKAIGQAIKEANRAGIPVFTADIASMDPGAKVVAHIATNNYQGGRQAAQAMIEALNGEGKVAIIDHPEVESVIMRTRGFRDQLEKSKAKIEIVSVVPGKGEKEPSFNAAQDILQAHPDLDGIFAINDPSALGVVAALEKAGKLEQVTVVGFDGMPEGKQAILDGKIYADPIQYPARIGKRVIETIAHYFDGMEIKEEILIPTGLYTIEDAKKDPALKS